jgi:hypothetical protein
MFCFPSVRIREETFWNQWSGRWDSNPRLDLGKVPYYPYTTTAPEQENFITSSALRQDRIVLIKHMSHTASRAPVTMRNWGPYETLPNLI